MNRTRLRRAVLLAAAAALAASVSAAPTAPAAQGANGSPPSTASGPRRVPDTMAQRLLACTPCHGAEGRASSAGYRPRIAGKPAGYLYNQLVNFRAGRRHNAAMTALLDVLDDAYLRAIAGHFAGLQLPYPPAQTRGADAMLLERGRQLVQDGDAARGLPACVGCHGTAMTGALPAFPGLLGLPRDYLAAQLGAWQTGLRHAAAPDCMALLARRLQGADVTALATWLSSQAVPADDRPAAAVPTPLPLDCGSGLR